MVFTFGLESEEEAASARHDCQRKRNEIVQLDNKLSQLNTELQLVTSKLKDGTYLSPCDVKRQL